MLTIKQFIFNPIEVNTYLLYDETKQAVIIDAACCGHSEEQTLTTYIQEKNLHPVSVLNTHCHIDHIAGTEFCMRTYSIGFEAHHAEDILLAHVPAYGELFGIPMHEAPRITKYLTEKDTIRFGNSELRLFHVPGHSPGSLVFYSNSDKMIFTGDVLFRNSIGRTDLPGGNYNELIHGIKNKIFSLPDDFRVLPGHGQATTIGHEKKTNTFLT